MAFLHKSSPDLYGIELSVGGIASTVAPYLSKDPTKIQIIVLFVFFTLFSRSLLCRYLFCAFCAFHFGEDKVNLLMVGQEMSVKNRRLFCLDIKTEKTNYLFFCSKMCKSFICRFIIVSKRLTKTISLKIVLILNLRQ